MSQPKHRQVVSFLQEFSIPLLLGVVVAMLAANLLPHWYEHAVHWEPFGDLQIFGHDVTLHFLVNDVFMVFFFGIAAKEITEACLPGGSLNPMKKAINPLLATMGGVVGPAAVFFLGLWALVPDRGLFPGAARRRRTAAGLGHADGHRHRPGLARGASGLRPRPPGDQLPAAARRGRRRASASRSSPSSTAIRPCRCVRSSWRSSPSAWRSPSGCAARREALDALHLGRRSAGVVGTDARAPPPRARAGLHRALPARPASRHRALREGGRGRSHGSRARGGPPYEHSPLHHFERRLKFFVDLGLFFFAFTNAGVSLAGIGPMTWLILGSLVIGKIVGISGLGLLAVRLGFPLPNGWGCANS